jgi:soluble lytic murein transglycosylase-like protein
MFKNIIKTFTFILFIVFASTANTKQSDYKLNANIPQAEYKAVYDWVTKYRCKDATGDVDKLIQLVYIHSKQHNLDPHLVLGQIKQESCFDTNARSFANAKGYMQVIAKWHPEEVKGRNLNNEYVGVEVGVTVLRKFIDLSKGNLSKALAKYSGGATDYYSKVVNNKKDLKRTVASYQKDFENNQRSNFLATERIASNITVASYSEKQDILRMFQHIDSKSKDKADALELLIRSKLSSV